jgi:hypothetical protein
MVFEEHRLEQMGERNIEAVEPVGGLISVVPVSMPAPARGEDHVPAALTADERRAVEAALSEIGIGTAPG